MSLGECAKRLNILVGADARPNPNSGAAGTVLATSEALARMGHVVSSLWHDDLPHRISHWNLHYLLELPRAYARAVELRARKSDFDVIQLSQPHAWLAAKDHASRMRRGVFVNRSHGLESMADTALERWANKTIAARRSLPRRFFTPWVRKALHRHIDLVAKYADGILVPAEDIKQHLIERHGARPEAIHVAAHGVPRDFSARDPKPMTEERLRRLLHIGQYSAIKGPNLLAESVQRALSEDSALTMTWVCDAADHGRVNALFRREFRARLNLREWVGQGDLCEVIDEHGIFVAHSLYEGAAKACTEAAARGLVLISTAVGALLDHFQSGNAAYLTPVGDLDAMATAILRASGDFERSRGMSLEAIRLTKHLTWENCACSSVRFYESLLLRKRGEI